MAVQFSRVISTQPQANDPMFSVRSIELRGFGERASPLVVVDDFRVRGRPFGPHPHAGFSAVTYVFEDSQGSLRSRDSLGGDYVVGSGGLVWTHAGSGMLHEETSADTERELHGLQFFVNLSSRNKSTTPRVSALQGNDVPEWISEAGDRVRVVVGTFQGVSSRLVPVEPFGLLDVYLQREIAFDLEDGHNAIVYVLGGDVVVCADGREQKVAGGHVLALHGGGRVTFGSDQRAHFLVLSGAEIHEPVVAHGPFIMNDRSQVDAAFARYRSGEMGHLRPRTD